MPENKEFRIDWSLPEHFATGRRDEVIEQAVHFVTASARRQMNLWVCETSGHEFEPIAPGLLDEPTSIVWFDAICKRCKTTRAREKEAAHA